MKCKRAQSLFSPYVDEALPTGEVRELEEHLSACEACRAELESWKAAATALSAVLDADAVPRASLEEFVAACRAGRMEHRGWFVSVVEWLSAPRRAVAATVVGSFALTLVLIISVWCVSAVLPMHDNQPQLISPQMGSMLSLADMDQAMKGEWQNGL